MVMFYSTQLLSLLGFFHPDDTSFLFKQNFFLTQYIPLGGFSALAG